MRSLYSAVSGLNVHQTEMDIIGNNISNVNTTGFKSDSATFQELYSQTLQGAKSAQDGTGGSNAIQIGLGVSLGSTTTNMGSGSIESTGNSTDVALDGNGFFIVNDGSQNYYTRAGSFSFDEYGYLTYGSNGYYVQGWLADENGGINTNTQNIENISLDLSMDPSETTGFDFTGNIDSTLKNTLNLSSSEIEVEDSAGNTDNISVELSKDSYNTWSYILTSENSNSEFEVGGTSSVNSISGVIELNNDGEVISLTANGYDLFTNDLELDIAGDNSNLVSLESHTAQFDINSNDLFADATTGEAIGCNYEFEATVTASADIYDSQGNIHTVSFEITKVDDNTWEINESDIDVTDGSNISLDNSTITLVFDDEGNLVSGDSIELSFSPDGLNNSQTISIDLADVTQYSADTDIEVGSSDGYASGSLESISFSESGVLVGSYDNGYTKSLAQLAIGNFSNDAGLVKAGDTLFKESSNSGEVSISSAGSSGAGTIQASSLESSNVDLSQELTEMIKAQRGYQANSKVITTSDEMLQTLMNIKR